MRNVIICASVLGIALGLATTAFSNGQNSGDEVSVSVAPQTLRLNDEQGGVVSVHTNIPYSSVECTTLALDGLGAEGCGADNRGHVVARFDEAAVKQMVSTPSAELTLTGSYVDGGSFAASDTVRVID